MKNDKIEVQKIDIKIGDKTISLKPEQAKELKKILNEMFEESPASPDKTVHHYWWHWPTYVEPYRPYQPSYSPWTITCGGGVGTSYTTSNAISSTMSAGTICLALS